MRPQETTKRLSVKLTDEEAQQKAQELAAAVSAAEKQREAIAEAKGAWAAKKKALEGYLDHLETEANTLAAVVEAGAEEREVACSWLYSLPNEAAFLVRDDTGELVQAKRIEEQPGAQQSLIEEVLREPTPEQLETWLPELPELPARKAEACPAS